MWQLLVGAVMISFSAVWVKLVQTDPTATAFYRMLLGGLVLAAIVTARREWTRVPARVVVFVLLAAFAFALDLLFWHKSILFVGPGLATLLANFQVFILAVTGIALFRERFRWELAVGIPLALAGLGLLVGPGWFSLGEHYQLGVVYGLLTAVCYAGYILSLRGSRVGDIMPSPLANMSLLSIACAAMLAAMALMEGESLAPADTDDVFLLLGYGITAQVLGWVLISTSLSRVRASQVGLVLLLQPTLAFIWDIAFFERPFGLLDATGAALAIGAIYLGSRQRAKAT